MQQTIVKTYKGTQQQATAEFQADAAKMAAQGYVPANQTWAPGSYGCGSFVIALLLCVVIIGILIFVYMLIVKPAGTLTVTYTFSAELTEPQKTCPKCAERVKAAAKVCRFCGNEFSEVLGVAGAGQSATVTPSIPDTSGAHEFGRKLGRLFAKK